MESGRPILHGAKEIGVGASLLGKWVKSEQEGRGAQRVAKKETAA
ncbi:hypothetical protein KBX51_04315 [Corynebacterium sp. CCUG 60159]|uniref:Transposase n=1 Tax=Corynebacterium pseudogenitalium TaxID=38303 RepID=A0ABD4TUU1_9CORY|nr:hypothetical protein [Corynebacterium pseudogenitalium]MCQ4615009.1 hypothetical protein [Corynebacterium pseudogenitalium]